jgi:hypothetical protein
MNRLAVVRIYSGALAGTPVPAGRNSCFIDPMFFEIDKTFRLTYSGVLAGTPVPARWNSCSGSLELLFRLAGIICFFDPVFFRIEKTF